MIWNQILRLVVAGLLGGAIGLERSLRAKEAGIRTHFLVALGSALFMLISQYGFEGAGRFDASRVAAQVVSGIGFLGAGIIIFQKNTVRGLTTAAGLWVASAIGLGCGAGMFALCGAATALVLICLEVMHFLQKYSGQNRTVVFTTDSQEKLRKVLSSLGKRVEEDSVRFEDGLYRVQISVITRKGENLQHLLDRLSSVTIESID